MDNEVMKYNTCSDCIYAAHDLSLDEYYCEQKKRICKSG
jgi:hypothetical protein